MESCPSLSLSPDPANGVAARRLLTAIIRRAVLDFALYKEADPAAKPLHYALASDAAGWLWWDGTEAVDDKGRYTFLHICALVGLDAQQIRAQALELTRNDLQRFSGDAT